MPTIDQIVHLLNPFGPFPLWCLPVVGLFMLAIVGAIVCSMKQSSFTATVTLMLLLFGVLTIAVSCVIGASLYSIAEIITAPEAYISYIGPELHPYDIGRPDAVLPTIVTVKIDGKKTFYDENIMGHSVRRENDTPSREISLSIEQAKTLTRSGIVLPYANDDVAKAAVVELAR